MGKNQTQKYKIKNKTSKSKIKSMEFILKIECFFKKEEVGHKKLRK